MEENEYIDDFFFIRVVKLINQMKGWRETVFNQFAVGNTFRSLSSKFGHVVATIEESNEFVSMFKEELESSLKEI